jgi:putative peptide zinc metalloprotease protein
MSASLFSASWYRVADLKPRLRSHVEINRHIYRGDVWYVVQDDATGRYHRFTAQAYCLVGLMDGQRTLEELWHSAGEQLGDDMPSQEEVIKLLSQLYRAGVIQSDVIPDIAELRERRRKEKQNKFWAVIKSPLAVKIPLVDPEPFLNWSAGVSRWLFNPITGLIWLWCVGWALIQTGYHWDELTENLADRVLAAENLFLIWLVYPIVKLVHEFGHAYAVKRWGGEVHEMGVMFLIFMPVPYVDASASAAFRSKYQRMLVAASGILVEAFIAVLAMWVWVSSEPGLVRSIAFNTLLIAGVSTFLFNGNPLLRFDAYYVLADGLEIPNLGSRSSRQVGYLCKRYLLGLENETSAAYSDKEGHWLWFYAIVSFIYRVFITLSIVLFVASELFFIGILLAILSLYNMFGKPLVAIVSFLITDNAVKKKRARMLSVVMSFLVITAGGLFLIPMPYMTTAQGIFWAPESAQLLSKSDGFLDEVLVTNGASVRQDQLLFKSHNPALESSILQAAGRMKELVLHYQSAMADERQNEAAIITEEIAQARAELARGLDEQKGLTYKSPADGVFMLVFPSDPIGRLVPRGTLLGYLLQPGEYRVRVAVGQDDVERVRNDVQQIRVRLSENIDAEYPAQLISEVPSAQKILPSPALSVSGGGLFALDPSNPDQPEAFETVFLFDVVIQDLPIQKIGERVYVRFQHSPEPIGYRLYRSARRVLLRQLEF